MIKPYEQMIQVIDANQYIVAVLLLDFRQGRANGFILPLLVLSHNFEPMVLCHLFRSRLVYPSTRDNEVETSLGLDVGVIVEKRVCYFRTTFKIKEKDDRTSLIAVFFIGIFVVQWVLVDAFENLKVRFHLS
jgi:hypothetical protein